MMREEASNSIHDRIDVFWPNAPHHRCNHSRCQGGIMRKPEHEALLTQMVVQLYAIDVRWDSKYCHCRRSVIVISNYWSESQTCQPCCQLPTENTISLSSSAYCLVLQYFQRFKQRPQLWNSRCCRSL